MSRFRLTREADQSVRTGSRTAALIFTARGVGYQMDERPKVGAVFCVLDDDLKGLQTSLVTEIIEDQPHRVRFRTLNSVYDLEVIH
jgi:hypothetical protein